MAPAANILVLGGTTGASALAQALADAGLRATLSYAGRVASPKAQPIPTRTGGFGGPGGLADYIRQNAITHVIDATHPFAAQMSYNAFDACKATKTPLIALERAPWVAQPGDHWTMVQDLNAAHAALPDAPTKVFLGVGRLHIAAFAPKPQHDYLLRLVDAPDAPLPLPNTHVVVARGPFDLAGDVALLRDHGTQIVVAKNAGGTGAVAKITAARELGLKVIMIDRPALPQRPRVETVANVLDWLHQP